ncbi:TPA: hypothetical protein SMO99_003008 [Proteus mirabilis]|uniref:Uncharacterized protein n=2 Tax=Morganellaceae TaxID=1903414 RepID=A0AAI9MSY0_MORMO|nr:MULTISPECIES: hypothetical protein [Providencia]EJV1664327.1 hypothetical protein [Klebsiella pneumoniae]EKW8762781.1 hypothetical protein [Morganella morganii]THB20507.1 hypothetical protein E6R27_20540 [Providencia sp. MGF014]HEJ9424968.1 hypothetical protein [Proteus mirabilis]ELI9034672.1 hypothetical protein [Morganella morganii]
MDKIDKFLLQELSLLRDEKGELARWVLQLQADLDTARREKAAVEAQLYRATAPMPVAEYQYRYCSSDRSMWSAWHSIPNESLYQRMRAMHSDGSHQFRELYERQSTK